MQSLQKLFQHPQPEVGTGALEGVRMVGHDAGQDPQEKLARDTLSCLSEGGIVPLVKQAATKRP